MPTNIFGGGAPTRAQVDTVVVSSVDPGDTFVLTITLDDGQTRSLTYTAETGDTASEVLAGLEALWNDSDDPAFTGATAEADTSASLSITSDNVGVPFDLSVSGTGGISVTHTTTNSGPSDWDVDANWSLGRKPINGDDVKVAPGTATILYHLNQTAVTLGSFKREIGHTGAIGREGAPLGSRGVSPRFYLRVNCTGAVEIYGAGTFVAIDLDTSAVSPIIDCTGIPPSTRDAVVYLKGSALNTPEIRNGYVRCEQMVISGDLYVTGTSVVVLQDDCDCDPTTTSMVRVASPNAAVIAYCGVGSVDLKKGAGYRQVKGVWSGTLTMQESCTAIADSEDTYGTVIAWGGTLVFDQTPGTKILDALTINSGSFQLKQLAGQVTINSLTENVKASDISTTIVTVSSV